MVICTQESTYTITGLTFKNIEHICLGLEHLVSENIDEPNRDKIIALSMEIERGLPDVGEILKG